jgi:hypothetical protein
MIGKTPSGQSESASATTMSDPSARRVSTATASSSHSATRAASTSSATQSRPVTRKLSIASFASSQHADSDPASSAATITRLSAQQRPINFTKTTHANTRAPHPINNGRMRLIGTSRPYFSTYPPQSMDRTSCPPKLGPTLSSTGLAFRTHSLMRFSRTLQRD